MTATATATTTASPSWSSSVSLSNTPSPGTSPSPSPSFVPVRAGISFQVQLTMGAAAAYAPYLTDVNAASAVQSTILSTLASAANMPVAAFKMLSASAPVTAAGDDGKRRRVLKPIRVLKGVTYQVAADAAALGATGSFGTVDTTSPTSLAALAANVGAQASTIGPIIALALAMNDVALGELGLTPATVATLAAAVPATTFVAIAAASPSPAPPAPSQAAFVIPVSVIFGGMAILLVLFALYRVCCGRARKAAAPLPRRSGAPSAARGGAHIDAAPKTPKPHITRNTAKEYNNKYPNG